MMLLSIKGWYVRSGQQKHLHFHDILCYKSGKLWLGMSLSLFYYTCVKDGQKRTGCKFSMKTAHGKTTPGLCAIQN